MRDRRIRLLVRRLRWAWLTKSWPPKEIAYVRLPSETVITPEIRTRARQLAEERGRL